MTYEVIWLRQLNLIFGVTSAALAIVLAAFMGGLALGSYIFGRVADKLRNPLILYALLELGIGVYALGSGFLFRGLDTSYIYIGRALGVDHFLIDLVKIAGSFTIILLPTTLMGGTLPVFSKAFIAREADLGIRTSLLYALNTVGAAVGTFITGFFLIRVIGAYHTTLAATACNVLAASLSLLAHYYRVIPDTIGIGIDEVKDKPPPALVSKALLLSVVGLSGMASLAYEVLWFRVLVYFLGLTTYAFSTMLTSFLMGITIGSFLVARNIDRLKRPFLAIGALQLIIGISALLFIPTIDFVYPFSQFLSTQLAADSWWGTTGVRFIIAMAIMLIPTVAMGATFPLAVRCFTSTVTKLGSGIGTVYAVNTIGSIVGSLLAGFVLIPLLNVRLAITVVLLINLLLAVAVFNHEGREDSIIRSWLRPATILLALLAILVADRSPMILASVEFQGIQKRYNLLFSSEGAEASLAVIEDKINGERELNINGESTASTIYQDMLVHKLLGHLPALFHPNPQDFLVVGFGLGATAYASTLYPGSSVDCVELVPDEVATAPFFAKQNHDVLNAPNFQLILGDGREYIKLTNTKYDIISFNAIHPKISPALYTEDFYRLCRRVLRDDGLIVAWMPPNAINQSEFWSLAKTFQNVFPNCSFWYVNPSHFLLLASPEPIDFNWQRLESRLAIPSIRNDLAETKVAEPYELLSNFVIANGELAALVVAAPINSDNLPVIEFSQVRTVTVNVEAMSAVLKNWRTIYPYLSQLPDSSQTAAIKDKLSLAIQVKKLVAEGQLRSWLGLYTQARQFFQRALAYQPENGNALYMLELINNQQAELEKLVQLNPENFRAHKALADIHLEQNRLDEARVLLLQAIRVQPEYADAHHALGVIEFKLDQLIAAKVSFETAIEGRSDFSAPWFYLGLVHWKMGDANAALECFQQAAGIDPATALHHYWLGLALTQTGRIADARSSFETALMVDPSYQPAREALEGLVR